MHLFRQLEVAKPWSCERSEQRGLLDGWKLRAVDPPCVYYFLLFFLRPDVELYASIFSLVGAPLSDR